MAFEGLKLAVPHRLDVIDVDAHPKLVERYDELVPVLTGARPNQPSVQLCHYLLDAAAVERFVVESK